MPKYKVTLRQKVVSYYEKVFEASHELEAQGLAEDDAFDGLDMLDGWTEVSGGDVDEFVTDVTEVDDANVDV